MSFEFPPIYEFRPFFTRQVNEQTWQAQLQNWSDLILSYCQHYRIWTLDLGRKSSSADPHNGGIDGELFNNDKIKRGLKLEVIREIFTHMKKKQLLQEFDGAYLVYFKNPQEWATAINDWINKTGQNGSVLTLFELSEGDLVVSQEFYKIHPETLRRAVDVLVQRNHAVLMKGPDGKLAGIKML